MVDEEIKGDAPPIQEYVHVNQPLKWLNPPLGDIDKHIDQVLEELSHDTPE